MPVVRLQSSSEIEALVAELLDPARKVPVVVVTTRNGEEQPLIDVDALAAAIENELGSDGVTVRLLRTGPLTWDLTGALPEGLGVFGAAARIWWTGFTVDDAQYRHPLIFAYSPQDAQRAHDRVLAELRSKRLRSAGDRGWQPRTAPVAPRRPDTVAPQTLPTGEIVWGVAREAAAGGAEIEVGPGSRGWLVRRRRDAEFEVGDQVAVRIVGYDSGVPLLERPPRSEELPPRPAPQPMLGQPTRQAPPAPTSPAVPGTDEPAQAQPTTVPAPQIVRPGPHLFRRNGDDAAPRQALASARPDAVAQTSDTAAVDGEIAALRAELDQARRQIQALTGDLKDTDDELRQAQQRAQAAEGELSGANRETRRQVRELKSEVKRGKDREQWLEAQLHGTGRYDDDERQFRHEVDLAWRRLLTDSERQRQPLVPYRLGPAFLPTLAALEGVSRPKVVEVCVEVLTGRAAINPAREHHALRTSLGGDAPQRLRPDGARAFRVSLQIKTPAARRLHFWHLPDGDVEFANVVVHDDFAIA